MLFRKTEKISFFKWNLSWSNEPLSNSTVFAQANQLDKLMTLKGNNDVEAKKLMRDYGYQNKLWNREET